MLVVTEVINSVEVIGNAPRSEFLMETNLVFLIVIVELPEYIGGRKT